MAAVPTQVIEFVERFDRNRDAYVSAGYNEAQLRHEFLAPFFETLGWDIANQRGNALPHRDVIFEDSVRVGGEIKSPDYSFRIGGIRRFSDEAKKPAASINVDAEDAEGPTQGPNYARQDEITSWFLVLSSWTGLDS